MKSFHRVAPYLLIIAMLLPLAGCPYDMGRHDRGGNRGRVDQHQSPGRDHDDRQGDGSHHPPSDRDNHDDSGRDHH